MSVKKIKIDYDIISDTIPILKEQLYKLLSNSEFVKLVLDIQNVKMIDSVGFGFLISIHNNLANNDKLLEIIKISTNFYEYFKHVQIDRFFEISK